jgi:hypothetical protein
MEGSSGMEGSAGMEGLGGREVVRSRQIDILTSRIDPLVTTFNPALQAGFGIVPTSPPSC